MIELVASEDRRTAGLEDVVPDIFGVSIIPAVERLDTRGMDDADLVGA